MNYHVKLIFEAYKFTIISYRDFIFSHFFRQFNSIKIAFKNNPVIIYKYDLIDILKKKW